VHIKHSINDWVTLVYALQFQAGKVDNNDNDDPQLVAVSQKPFTQRRKLKWEKSQLVYIGSVQLNMYVCT